MFVTEDATFPPGAEEEERELDHGREEEVNVCEKGELERECVQAKAAEPEGSRALSCVCVCAAVSVEHLSEVVRHVGLHGLKISASRFKEPRIAGDPDPDFAAVRSGTSDRPAVDQSPFQETLVQHKLLTEQL